VNHEDLLYSNIVTSGVFVSFPALKENSKRITRSYANTGLPVAFLQVTCNTCNYILSLFRFSPCLFLSSS
jgi:hypothetical protein